jgi:hypothetical protein
MQSSLSSKKKRSAPGKKFLIFLLFFVFISTSLLAPVKPVEAAGMPVVDIPKLIWDKVQDVIKTLWQKGASLAFQQTLRSVLNKMAYDTANWIGSGGEGQKPLFVTQGWGSYMAQIGDEAAGTFLENFTANWSQSREGGSGMTLNYCQPSSLDVKLKIALGLSQQYRPSAPSCTASKMIDNWTSAAKEFADYQDPNFLDKFVNIFDPVSSDMGIYWEASTDMMQEKIKDKKEAETTLLGKGGWLDPLTIDDKPISLPSQAELQIEGAYGDFSANIGKYTGDAFIDAANIFLNQLALSAFNKLIQNIGKQSGSSSAVSDSLFSGFEADPSFSGGETALKKTTTKLIQPNFGVRADYNILSELSICPDPKNPGPSYCVIDNKFMQAISEQKTVAEALQEGYLNGSWQFEVNSLPGAYQNSYTWRNISILRKYRIVPASWEQVFEKIDQYNQAADRYPDKNYEKKRATLMDLVSCFSPYDEYNQFSAQFDANDQAWCTGLVDPNWVLKAPLNYCKKEGISSQILNKYIVASQPAYGTNPYIPSSITITRADNYCADNQTCIKEAKDGSCLAYGYCNEEKRTWSFESESCEPIDNTCQAFVTDSGDKVAYLENTLDYENCSAENAGCKQYSYFGSYNYDLGTISWNANDSLYLNNKANDCSSKDEGCSEFIRIKPAWGANLVMNSNFINDSMGASSTTSFLNEWPVDADYAEIVDSAKEPGDSIGKALKLEAAGSALLFSDKNNSLLPKDFDVVFGQAYTVSADVYLAQGNRVVIALGSGSNRSTYESRSTGSWHHISVSKTTGDGLTSPDFSLAAYGSQAVVYIKNIKFEMSGWDTGFSSYADNKSYQKLLPEYLESTCYVGQTADGFSYQFKESAPAQCYNYARRCDQGEVGCELYTALEGDFSVPAKVSSTDYCPSECLGYDIYISRQTNFNSPQAENIIPQNATICSVEAVGCNEFTNLDDLSTGGENKEYYSALKHCVKPGQAECANFYAWEKTINGSQLQLYTLQVGTGGNPETISDDSSECNAEIYNASIDSPLYNPDCREFYDTEGVIYYHLNSKVITCSDDCRSYRMTEKNYDFGLSQAECVGLDRNWDSQEGACIVCLNSGTWSQNHQSCLYQGIPGEGKICQISESGCREYNGSAGNNVRLIVSYDFEGLPASWTSNCSNGISLADVSSDKEGKSLYYNNSASNCSEIGSDRQVLSKNTPLIKQIIAGDNMAAQLKIGSFVTQGKAYNVKFWASSSAGANVKIYFYNPDTKEKSEFNTAIPIKVKSGGGWQLYAANLEELDHKVSNNEILAITADNNFYLDNFILTEIVDRYYLIKSSSKIPDICYYDIFDVYQGADYNLGCSAYNDRSGTRHNLHSFSDICASSAVGCEQVIKTHNYSPYGGNIWGDDNENKKCDIDEPDCVEVEGDSSIYLVYDSAKICNRDNLGCSRLGEAVAGTSGSAWSDVFKKNNPNQYNQILCEEESLGCEEWRNDSGGFSYFRDPGNNVCVYRSGVNNPSGEKAWYKASVKRCDLNSDGEITGGEQSGAVCLNDNDCNKGVCISDNNDYLCPVSYLETVGYGGLGGRVPVPSENVAKCSVQSSSCREYIDPVSNFNPDLLISANGNTISLQPNKLYVLTVKDKDIDSAPKTSLSFPNGEVARLLPDNTFAEPETSVSIDGSSLAVIFNSLNTKIATFNGNKADIVLRELAIAYQLNSEIDKSSCNGLVNFNNGCVLFNERSIAGASGYADLSNAFDPYLSQDGDSPVNCNIENNGSCAANQLIKVRPDRVCATWFTCSTYAIDETTGQQVCYDLELCNSLGEDGQCANFLDENYELNPGNATGYYIQNKYNISKMDEVGLNSNAHYSFEELVPSLYCVRRDGTNQPCSFDNNIVKDLIIREPDKAKVDYPVAGESYLRVPSAYSVSPMSRNSFINLSENQDYYLSYLVNTKNSSGNAMVVIKPNSSEGNKGITFTSSAPNGWERKVHHFDTIDGDYSQIMLFLTSENKDIEGEVYFDDINIEPVLKISDNQYAARECRLYPNSDSFDCRDYNQDVVSEGLEGYCLEYDRDNPDVCLTWYPVDRISSSLGGAALGYNGPNGLSYCTNINSNIKFAKKVSTNLIAFNIDESRGNFWSGITNSGRCPDNWDDYENLHSICLYCHPEYNMTTTTAQMCLDYFDLDVEDCVSCDYKAGYAGYIPANSDMCMGLNANTYCGDATYYRAIGINHKANWNNHESVYCVPNDRSDKFLFGVGKEINARMLSDGVPNVPSCNNITFYKEAWMEYDGRLIQEPVIECQQREDIHKICEPINEALNAEPPIRIYNPDYPTHDEQGLGLLAADKGDRDKVFNFTCSEFVQVVSSSGENKAWTVRTSTAADPDYAFETPDFFQYPIAFGTTYTDPNLQKYGRQRNGVPYGAATFDANYDLLNSGPIYLQNQYYQKEDNEIFAGRPYGCSGESCANVGYCSENPNVLCVYYPDPNQNMNENVYHYINTKTCSDGGFGVCQPLWTINQESGGVYAKNVLSQIFKESYGGFKYQAGNYIPEDVSYPRFSGGDRPTIYPTSINLYLNNKKYSELDDKPSGIYALKFNTRVDAEQQPLNMIYIDWGDGSSQAITGIDHRPDSDNKHIFYHYYDKSPRNADDDKIIIKIWDNWNLTATSSFKLRN